MGDLNSVRRAHKVRVHCPLEQSTFSALLGGDGQAIERDPTAAKMLAIIRADNPLGDFGDYKGVVEISLGLESFVPAATATPTLGVVGTPAISPTAILTTYVDEGADLELARAALRQIAMVHPWETPVIEFDETPVQLIGRP
jgi:hypothetical protein